MAMSSPFADLQLGASLPPVSQRFHLDMFKSGDIKTIHNDQEAAEREGLKAPIAVGPQVAALIFRMMRSAFRQHWIIGGRCSLTFRRITPADAFATAHGVLRSKTLEGDAVRLEFDVWVETENGEKSIVGSASALVPLEAARAA
jgi:acyl dehydratase